MVVSVDNVSRAAMERDLLLNGGWTTRLSGAKWVIVDMDGTLADHTNVRDAYDESRLIYDEPYPVVVEWVQNLYPHYNLLIVSGRKDSGCDDTCLWLERRRIPFDHILMRSAKDSRPDDVVKKEILDDLLLVISKDDIAFVLDDRPKVVRMWKANGLTCFPVRGAVEEF